MPKWIDKTDIQSGKQISDEELPDAPLPNEATLSPKEKSIIQKRYNLIAPILPIVHHNKLRCSIISEIASRENISKQTIRNYLYRYLTYDNITALLPRKKEPKQALSDDEKNMRWALNKFYFNRNKNSLNTAYTLMLKEKYCDEYGILFDKYPSIHQFKYFYRKHRSLQTEYISRDGLSNYQRNKRPLLGDGVQEFATNVGTGMFDSTVCDIYLVNESGDIIGRPILTACVDAYSGMCCGYALTWEGGIYSLKKLLVNILADKVDWCKKFGISISKADWDCDRLPSIFVTDMGTEYTSKLFEQITDLGIKIINLPPYRPELKGVVEKFFDLIQSNFKKYLKGKGVVNPDFQERGVRDYRKEACLTINELEKIILHCIIYHNSQRVLRNFPYTREMLSNEIKPYSNAIWNYGRTQPGANLIKTTSSVVLLTLLPRTMGKFARDGLKVNKLRYRNDLFTEKYLSGGEAVVAYDPDDASSVWLLEDGVFVKFNLIETRFKNKDLSEIHRMKKKQNEIIKKEAANNIQSQINLADHITTIVNTSGSSQNNGVKNIRKTRKKEIDKSHIVFMKDGVINE